MLSANTAERPSSPTGLILALSDTHGAIWSVIAFAMLGDGDKAAGLFSLINPINHAGTPQAALLYAVEPYVVAADVYGIAPHVGRGGWTWYTGSAGWMSAPAWSGFGASASKPSNC